MHVHVHGSTRAIREGCSSDYELSYNLHSVWMLLNDSPEVNMDLSAFGLKSMHPYNKIMESITTGKKINTMMNINMFQHIMHEF